MSYFFVILYHQIMPKVEAKIKKNWTKPIVKIMSIYVTNGGDGPTTEDFGYNPTTSS